MMSKRYIIDFARLRQLISASSNFENKESEIIEVYDTNEDDESQTIELMSKTQREVSSFGNKDEDLMVFDIMKLLITKIISSDSFTIEELTVAEKIAFDTLIENKIIIEYN